MPAEMSQPATFCVGCGGTPHEPAPPGAYVDFRGRRYREPFRCLCCGKEICYKQFCWGRTCGYCDSGQCEKGIVVGPDFPADPRDAQLISETGHNRKDIIEAAEVVP